MNNPHYRADIDGLRAVAVISVLLFHFGVEAFSGGFVGVDVFFVISGFLITRLIKNDLAAGHFSLGNFYLRRIRRLFPALFATLLTCFIYAYQVFSAQHFERFGGSLFYSVLSISNIYFWNEQGYFDTEAIFKPLLHTWTLSVEEQFYLIWPALLMLLLTDKSKPFAAMIIGLIGIISLYAAQSYLAIDANAVFFLTPFRIIEFSIGAVTVWLVQFQRQQPIIEEIVLLCGLVLIGYAVFTFDNHTNFPGNNALVPCIGTAMVIYAGQARYCGKLLSNWLAVNIGLISYSIYLIHWPLYVFYQYPVPDSLNNTEIIVLLAVTLLLATLMYYLVETPFRGLKIASKEISTAGFTLGCIASVLLTTLLAAHVLKNNGWPWRYRHPQIAVRQSDYKSEMDKRYIHLKGKTDCLNKISAHCTSANTIDGLVVGDSHAVDGYNALTSASEGSHQLTLLTEGGCDPVVNPETQIPPRWPDRIKCIEINKRWFNPQTYKGFDYLVVSPLFGNYFLARELKQYLQFIKSQTQIKHIIVFGNYIQLTQDLQSIIQNGEELQQSVLKFKRAAFLENEQLKLVCKEMACLFIDKQKLLCKNEDIRTCKLELNGIPFTWDSHHLSLEFSTLLGQLAKQQINRYLSEPLNSASMH